VDARRIVQRDQPVERIACRFTHSCSVAGLQPILAATELHAAHREGYSLPRSSTILTALSRTSEEYLLALIVSPSHLLEPPVNPGRFNPQHPQSSIQRQCHMLGLARSSYYWRPQPESEENLALLRRLDELCLEHPPLGGRRLAELCRVNRKRIRRLMRIADFEALYPKPRLSRPGPGREIHPYLLRNLVIDRPNQVWSSDITYVPMRRGFLSLVAVMDWFSRYVLSWELSTTMDTSFCLLALEAALDQGAPEIFNTDQGSQFTSADFTGAAARLCSRSAKPKASSQITLPFLATATTIDGTAPLLIDCSISARTASNWPAASLLMASGAAAHATRKTLMQHSTRRHLRGRGMMTNDSINTRA
jgi:putative transposase